MDRWEGDRQAGGVMGRRDGFMGGGGQENEHTSRMTSREEGSGGRVISTGCYTAT